MASSLDAKRLGGPRRLSFVVHASAFVNPRSARFIGYFVAKGYDVQVVTTAPRGENIDCTSVLDGGVRYQVSSVLLPPWQGGLIRQIFDRVRFILTAARAIRSHQPHEIVATDIEGLLSAALSPPGEAFVIYDIRDSTKVKFYRLPQFAANVLDWIESRLVRRASAVIIVDRRRAVELHRSVAAHAGLEVIENFASDSAATVPSVPRLACSNELQVCLCGYLIPQRGVEWALRSVQDCPGVRLVVYGTPAHGIDAERIRKCPNAIWLGNLEHDQSLAQMAASDLVLALYDPAVAGHRFAAPGKLYEALMLGRPVLVNRGTSLEGIVEEDRVGYVIDYDLKDALRDCLLRAAGERLTRLPELGRNARAAFERKYNWSVCEAKLDALEELAAVKPGR